MDAASHGSPRVCWGASSPALVAQGDRTPESIDVDPSPAARTVSCHRAGVPRQTAVRPSKAEFQPLAPSKSLRRLRGGFAAPGLSAHLVCRHQRAVDSNARRSRENRRANARSPEPQAPEARLGRPERRAPMRPRFLYGNRVVGQLRFSQPPSTDAARRPHCWSSAEAQVRQRRAQTSPQYEQRLQVRSRTALTLVAIAFSAILMVALPRAGSDNHEYQPADYQRRDPEEDPE